MKRIFLILVLVVSVFSQVNGVIWEQDLCDANYGYSVAKFWGSHYDMSYAFGALFADDIYGIVEEIHSMILGMGYTWDDVSYMMSLYVYKPDIIETEFQAIADGVNDNISYGTISADEVKAFNLFGDIAYACRAVASWGATVSLSEFSTISTRRLDYDAGFDGQYHHVIAIFQPDDGSPNWINFAWPGFVSSATGLNEYGTVASLHDYWGSGMTPPNALPRVLACRYALTMVDNPDISTHLTTVYDELSTYNCPTPGFLNYFVPDGHGGVILHNRISGYYSVRLPHPDCYDGQAIYTNNSDISGASVGEPWSGYYSANATDGNITMDGQWTVSGPSFHRLTVGYRGHGDMKIWFDGVLPYGYTDRVELEWNEVLAVAEKPHIPEDFTIVAYPNPFNSAVNISIPDNASQLQILDLNGNLIYRQQFSINSNRSISWSPEDRITSGVYLVNVISDCGLKASEKLVFIK